MPETSTADSSWNVRHRNTPTEIIATPKMSESLRFGEAYRAHPPEDTFYDYSVDGGWDKAIEKCSGMAVCHGCAQCDNVL